MHTLSKEGKTKMSGRRDMTERISWDIDSMLNMDAHGWIPLGSSEDSKENQD
jgi:outer membrane protease